MQSAERYCVICKYKLEAHNQQYYCCSRNERYCIMCRDKLCLRCNGMITKMIQNPPRCSLCLRIGREGEDMLEDDHCDKAYCSSCVVTRIGKLGHGGTLRGLPCGHQVGLPAVQAFVRGKYCFVCGRKVDGKHDYELMNGHMCCQSCLNFERDKITDLIQICMGCQQVIRLRADMGKAVDGFPVCRLCIRQSEILLIEQQNRVPEPAVVPKVEPIPVIKPKDSNIYEVKISQPRQEHKVEQPKQKLASKPVPITIPAEQAQIIDPFKHIQDSHQIKQVNELIEVQPPKPTGQVISSQTSLNSSPSTPRVQRRNSKQSQSSNRSHRKKVLQEFPPDEEDSLPNSRLKKHFSVETYVEKMKIAIDKPDPNTIVCSECRYEIPKKQCFSIEKPLRGSLPYCRLCYTFLTNNQALGFHPISSLLDLPRDAKQRNLSSQKTRNNDLSKTADGHRVPTTTNCLPAQSPTAQNNNHQRLTGKVRVIESRPVNKQACAVCKIASGASLILTQDVKMCLTCYYARRNNKA